MGSTDPMSKTATSAITGAMATRVPTETMLFQRSTFESAR